MTINDIMDKIRKYRSQKLEVVGKFLLRCHINANALTSLSLLTGIVSVFFLFQDHLLFLLFALLHLIFDSLDGVVARLSTSTSFGSYFDTISDSLVTFFLIIKIGLYLQDYFIYIIASLFLFSQLIYLLSCKQAPVLFTRTVTIILLSIFPLSPSILGVPFFLTIIAAVTGVASIYSLAKQLQWVSR